MSDFDFDDLAVKADDTAELHLPQLARGGRIPVLIMAPATEENRAFWNAIARIEKGRARQRQGDATSPEVMRQRREESAGVLAKTVVRGWRDVTDKNGAIVPFSAEECLKWFLAIIAKAPDVWLEIHVFPQDRSNFRNQIDTEEAAKNS